MLAGLLPAGWRELARSTGAMRRARGEISSPDQLLQLLLLHVGSGLSLKQAVARAEAQGLASISDVGLLKRLRNSEAWLRELSRGLFDETRFASINATPPEGRRLRAIDATTVEEPGVTGTDWRVHYSISLPELRCDYYELTDVKGAESYKRIPVSSGDIILADRGYCRREDVAHVLSHGGDAIVRLSSTGFPLCEPNGGQSLALLPLLRTLQGCTPGEWPVSFEAAGTTWNARVCAIRKSVEAAELAKKKLQRRSRRRARSCSQRRSSSPSTSSCSRRWPRTFCRLTVSSSSTERAGRSNSASSESSLY